MADEYEKLKLSDKIVSLYDFSTLVSQLIEGGVVPLESLGVPYPMANDDLFKISSIKAKGQQLLKYIELFGKKYPKNKSILKNINNTIFEIYSKNNEDLIANAEDYLNHLRNLQNKLEDEINENNKNIIFLFIFYIIFIFLGLVIAFDIYTLKTIVFEKNTRKNIVFFCITIIFGLYFSLLMIIIYPSNILYNKLFTSIINQYYSYAILFLLFIILRFKKFNIFELIYYC